VHGVARLFLQGRDVVLTPRAKGAKDLNDLLRNEGVESVRRILNAPEDRVGFNAGEMEAFLEEVAWAPDLIYDSCREAIANALKLRLKTLDEDRDKRRQAVTKKAEPDELDVEPWLEPVPDVAAVANTGIALQKRYLDLPDVYHDTIMLWVFVAHLLLHKDLRVSCAPRLAIQSPEMECGKSTALIVASLLSPRAVVTSSITPAALFRAVDSLHVSLFIDESDNILTKGFNPELLAILNSGIHSRTAKVLRVEALSDGRLVPKFFKTFAPIAFTSIKELPPTLQDRSHVVPIQRVLPDVKLEALTSAPDVEAPFIDICRQFTRAVQDLTGPLPVPAMPPELRGRLKDKWCPLFQAAYVLGGDWPERCRKAALAAYAHAESTRTSGAHTDLLQIYGTSSMRNASSAPIRR
jgi:putative DNA primase/helicase